MKIHVHVYKVVTKAEIDSEKFGSIEDAEKNALNLAKSNELNFVESDCRFIALGFEISKEDRPGSAGH